MSLAAPGTNPASNLELKLPHTIGSANQLLKVDGSGQLGWATDSTTDSTKLPLAGGTLTGALTVGAKISCDVNSDISMSSSGDGQLVVGGNGYTSAIALNDVGMQIYHNSSSRSIIFGINETEKVRIDSSGRLLVGTSSNSISSSEIFEVKSTGSGFSHFRNNSSSYATIYIDNEYSDTGFAPFFTFTDGGGNRGGIGQDQNDLLRITGQGGVSFYTSGTHGGGSERLQIKSDGRICMGSANVGSGSADDLNIENTGDHGGITIRTPNNKWGSIHFADGGSGDELYRGQVSYDHGNDWMRFYAAGAEKLRIVPALSLDTIGNLGINVYGGSINHTNDAVLYCSKTNNADWAFEADADSGGFGGDYAVRATVANSASYGMAVYDMTNTTWRFRVNGAGAIYATNTTVQSISDQRLKENIVDANSQWNDIKALRFRNFKWKDDSGNADGKTYLGLIAQEVEPISPNLVEINAQTKEDIENEVTDPEYKNVKYSIVWMKAVKALQEAQARIETLEAEVAALKAS